MVLQGEAHFENSDCTRPPISHRAARANSTKGMALANESTRHADGPLANDRTQRASDRSDRATARCLHSIPLSRASSVCCDSLLAFRPQDHRTRSIRRTQFGTRRGALEKSDAGSTRQLARLVSQLCGIRESHRSGGPGVIGDIPHSTRDPASVVFQKSTRCSSIVAGLPKGPLDWRPTRYRFAAPAAKPRTIPSPLRCKRRKDPATKTPRLQPSAMA